MKREFGFDQITRDDRSVVTVGTFDGVHLGHQALIQYLIERAADQQGRSVVVTFDPHPQTVVSGRRVPLLTTIDERADVLAGLGLDRLVVIPFTEAFSRLSSDEFVRDVLVHRIGLQEVVLGHDHGFGRNREGNLETLERMSEAWGFTTHAIPAQVMARAVVSSSRIRDLLTVEGNVTQAAELLGRPYQMRGTVIRGAARGRTIGFPTANLERSHPDKVIPAIGVYAVRVTHQQTGQVYNGMMNIGRRPTVTDASTLTVEVHLLDFEGDLYGDVLRVDLVERLRDEQRFASLEKLVEQLNRDQARCYQVLGPVH